MLWGSNQIDEFTSTINDTLDAGNIHMVLGMNEYVVHAVMLDVAFLMIVFLQTAGRWTVQFVSERGRGYVA